MASVLCVIVLGWFSLRLKRDLDFVRNRLSKGEFLFASGLLKVSSFTLQWFSEYPSSAFHFSLRFNSVLIFKEPVCKLDTHC